MHFNIANPHWIALLLKIIFPAIIPKPTKSCIKCLQETAVDKVTFLLVRISWSTNENSSPLAKKPHIEPSYTNDQLQQSTFSLNFFFFFKFITDEGNIEYKWYKIWGKKWKKKKNTANQMNSLTSRQWEHSLQKSPVLFPIFSKVA